jgi:hypothetical protein
VKYLVQGFYCKKWRTYVESGSKEGALHQLGTKRLTQPDIKWRLVENKPAPKTCRSPAYHEGWAASLDRQPLERNPHPPGDSQFKDWRSGWKEANDAKRVTTTTDQSQ